ncbi:hypothetical protein A7456_07035 [Moraxella nonliquefaciens]|uniref:Uncharacterized protein n=1 Tax=Moraxella nonliquefaciens TaxID=478 RepID=A0A1B8QH96_MORNO|nr:hypothetical protein A7456_07035 [Moraxella nonliquefaciens]
MYHLWCILPKSKGCFPLQVNLILHLIPIKLITNNTIDMIILGDIISGDVGCDECASSMLG